MYDTQTISSDMISLTAVYYFIFFQVQQYSSMILLAYVTYKKLHLKSSSIPNHTINASFGTPGSFWEDCTFTV